MQANQFKRYDTGCYLNVRSKADISQLNLPHHGRPAYKRVNYVHLHAKFRMDRFILSPLKGEKKPNFAACRLYRLGICPSVVLSTEAVARLDHSCSVFLKIWTTLTFFLTTLTATKVVTRGCTDCSGNIFHPVIFNTDLWPWPSNLT